MKDKLARFFKLKVELKAHGLVYRGLLVGADEEFVYLRGPTMWITIPMEAVTAIRKEGGTEKEWVAKKVEGAPKEDPGRSLEKRRFSAEDFARIHGLDEEEDWPRSGSED